MISIIIPAYNCESTLTRCMDSILGQDYADYEILLVDDGSVDGTPALCDSYAARDSRIRVFHKANGGVSSARNVGLDNAVGEWITFVDSDDEITDGSLSLIFNQLPPPYTREYYLILENSIYIHPGNQGVEWYDVSGFDSMEMFYEQGRWGSVWNKTFARNVIEEHNIRFDTTFRFYEDWLFVATYCAFAEGIKYIKTPCYIEYAPESFYVKYREYQSFEYELHLYLKIKTVNRAASISMVDSLTMKMLRSISDGNPIGAIREFKNAVGKDIRYARGKSKFAIRHLSGIDCFCVWKLILRLSSILFKNAFFL